MTQVHLYAYRKGVAVYGRFRIDGRGYGYGPKGMPWERAFDAARRLAAYYNGEVIIEREPSAL